MRIGIYCGSFDPVHRGHVRIARACVRQELCDEVWVIPTGNYWHKQDLSPVQERIALWKLYESDTIKVDSTHNEIPYTYELFRELKKEYPEHEFCLVLGGDNLVKFDEWKEYRELLNYRFLILPREPVNAKEVRRYMKQFNKENYDLIQLKNIPISSSYIRSHPDDFEAVKGMVDKKVFELRTKIRKKRISGI